MKKCSEGKERVYMVGSVLLSEAEHDIPEKLLELFERKCSAARKDVVVFFQRGKERATQVAYCATFYAKCKDFLQHQVIQLNISISDFALKVMEYMLQKKAATARTVYWLTQDFSFSASDVFQLLQSTESRQTLEQSLLSVNLNFEVTQY